MRSWFPTMFPTREPRVYYQLFKMEWGKDVESGKDDVKKKRKRVSKKSKRSWRKHVDITDIEEHLDEVRRQERTG